MIVSPGSAPTINVSGDPSSQRFFENLLWTNMMEQWKQLEEHEDRLRQLEERLDKAAAVFAEFLRTHPAK